MTDHVNEARIALRKRFHEAAADRETMFVKLRPLRAAQKFIRDQLAALNAQEGPIVEQIHAIERELVTTQYAMSEVTGALSSIDGTPHPSVGLAPDGRDPPGA